MGKDNECIEQPHYTYAICNAWFQAWFFSSWRLDVGPILLYNLFPIFLLHFWGFKLSKFIIFIMFRTISGHSEITDDHRRASAPLCVHRQIFLYWVTLDIEQPHYIYTICNAWFQACFFFFYLMYFFLRILLLNVWEILYNLFHIFLLHFWGFKLSKFIVFIMLRTISGCSQTIDGDRSIVILIARKASASLLGGWQIFFPLLSNQRKNSYLRTITYSVRVHDFRSNSVKLL